MDRPDNGLYFDCSVEPQENARGEIIDGFEVSIACDDPQFFEEGTVATPDQSLPWLVTRIQKLVHRKLGK